MERTEEYPFLCSFCGLHFKRKSSLNAHVDALHEKSRTYTCSECQYSSTHVSHFKTHLQKHANPDELLESALASIPNYCAICKRYFRRDHALTEHMALEHDNARPYSCDVCDTEFKTLVNYRSHMKLHDRAATHECGLCGEKFQRVPDLKKHMIENHEKRFKCDECGEEFARGENLKQHMETHSAPKEQRRRFACPVDGCSSSFTRKSNLNTHMQTVHGGVQPHFCEVCGKDFRYPCLLAKHVEVHDKQQPEMMYFTEEMIFQPEPGAGDTGLIKRMMESAVK